MGNKQSPQRGTNSGNPPNRDVNAAKRVSMAVSMRASKETYEAVAHACGYADASSARKAVLREMNRVVVRNVDELRQEESAALDLLQKECMELFLDKDNRYRLSAAHQIIEIMERRSKLLGLDLRPESAIAAAQVIIREVPAGYLGEPKS